MDLFPFQRTGIEYLRTRTRALLGDDPGTGKSRQLLEALPEAAAVLVICPNAVKGAWASEVEKWRPDYKPLIVDGRKNWRWPMHRIITIANYDILPDETASAKEMRAWGTQRPLPVILIGDEIQYGKSADAERTKRFRGLANAIRGVGGTTWGATGTPIMRDAMDLWNVLVALGLEQQAVAALPGKPEDGWWPRWLYAFSGEAKEIYVPGGKKRRVIEWGQPRPCAAAAFRAVALRRTRAEVLPDLPTKLYQDVLVPLDADDVALSTAALAALEAAGIDLETALRESTENARKIPALEKFAHARAALATAKWPHLGRLVQHYRELEERVIVFSAHRAPVLAIASAVRIGDSGRSATITGDDTAAARTATVAAFQAGDIDVLACTIQAAGVGLTLTAGALAIFADLSVTPAANAQAEDRLCRIGQTRGVRIVRLLADHALDRRITEICTRKTAQAAVVLQDPIGARRGPKSAEDLTTLARLEVILRDRLLEDPLAEDFASHALASLGSGGTLSERQWAQLHQIAESVDIVAGFAGRPGGA